MITILFTKEKTLVQTVRESLYAGERNLSYIRFLLPSEVDGEKTSEFTVIMKYSLPDGDGMAVTLTPQEENYKAYMVYLYPISGNFTSQVGDVDLSLSLIRLKKDGDGFKSDIYQSSKDFIEIQESVYYTEYDPEEEEDYAKIYWEARKELFPEVGKEDVLYVATDENKLYRYDAETGDYVVLGGSLDSLPVATRETLGAIKIGDHLLADELGKTDVDTAKKAETDEMLEEIFGEGESTTATNEEVTEAINEVFASSSVASDNEVNNAVNEIFEDSSVASDKEVNTIIEDIFK